MAGKTGKIKKISSRKTKGQQKIKASKPRKVTSKVKEKKEKKVSKSDLLNISKDWDKIDKTRETISDLDVDDKKVGQDKKLMMWTGVIFFMALILFVWVLNIKNVFETKPSKNIDNSVVEEWNDFTEEFSKTWDKVRQDLDKFREAEELSEDNNVFIQPNQEQIGELETRLKSKLGQDEQAATSAATTTTDY